MADVRVSWTFVATVSFITSLRLPIPSKLKRLSRRALYRQAFVESSVRKASPVDIIAQAILASLFARATATMRSGFLALMATIHSARAPLYLWATRKTDVHPTTSILRRYRLPFLVIAELVLAAARVLARIMPRDALKSLPDLKTLGSGLKATIADAISGPKAGISSSNRLIWFLPLARAIARLLQIVDLFVEAVAVRSQHHGCLLGLFGKGLVALRQRQQFLNPVNALGRDQAEFREMPAQRIDGHGSLLDQQFPGLV